MYKSQIPFRSFDTLDKIEGKLAFEHLIAKFIFFKITILTDKSFPLSNFYNLHSLPSINTSHKRDERFFSPLSLSSSERDKTEEQKFIFQIGTLNPKVLTNAFHSTNLFFVFAMFPPTAWVHFMHRSTPTTHVSSFANLCYQFSR